MKQSKENKKMTQEELQKQMRENLDKMQDEFIDKLEENISWLCEKANKKDYIPTVHEKQTFEKIFNIINNMAKWF